MRFLVSCILITLLLTACTPAAPAPATPGGASNPAATRIASAAHPAIDPDAIQGFKMAIELTSQGEPRPPTLVYFLDQYAIDLNPDTGVADAVYDLEAMHWTESATGEQISFNQCLDWAASSTEATRLSLAELEDANLKAFIENMLSPNFTVKENGATLTVENQVMNYQIVPTTPPHPEMLVRFFAYDRLNACRKAMYSQQLPPYAQLAVDQEMEARNIFPGKMKVTVLAPDQVFESSMKVSLVDLTEAEAEMLQPFLPK